MFPILQIGPLAVQLPGLFILLGVWVGMTLAERAALKHAVAPGDISNLVLVGLVAGLIGARLGYATRYADVYLASPLSLVALTPVTLAPADGAAVGLIACLIYGQRMGLRLWATLDGLAPGLAVVTLAVAFAHLASGDAFGAPASLPWSVTLWGAARHPSQVYEILAAAGVLGVVLRSDSKAEAPGLLFLKFVVLASGARLFLEAFRGDSVIVLGGLRQAQLVALGMMLLSLAGMHLRTSAELGSQTGGRDGQAAERL